MKTRATLWLSLATGLMFAGILKPPASRAEAPVPLALVPWPRSVMLRHGSLPLTPASRIVASEPSLTPLAAVLQGEIGCITGMKLRTGVGPPARGDIGIALDHGPADLEYRISVSDRVMVSGGNYVAVALGTATLLQALEVRKDRALLPQMTVRDSTTSSYRGAMLDLGRKYHTIEGIEQVVELCRLYKIRFLQLHLADDQLFMFPSAAFPRLGAGNSEFARFDPPSTSGPIRTYTAQELKELENFSRDRGVAIVPEIDMPGHSSRLTGDAPEAFLATPQNGATIDFASPRAFQAVTTLLNEEMDIFRSTPYVHLGADEVSTDGLDQLDAFRAALQEFHLQSVQDLYHKFIRDMNDVVNRRGKRAIVWEEAYNPDLDSAYPLPKNAVILVWSLSNSPQQMLDQGYQVINGAWTPLYIVRDDKRPVDFIYRWSLNQFGSHPSVFKNDWKVAKANCNLLGAQLCSWENPECEEIQSLRGRLAAVAERVWRNGEPDRPFRDFSARLAHTDAVLELLVNTVTLSTRGPLVKDENAFDTPILISMRSHDPRLQIRYTLDSLAPDAGSSLYRGAVTLKDTAWIRAASFTASGRRVGYISGSWFRRIPKFERNLATGKPVTVTNHESDTDPRIAVDGDVDLNRYWSGRTPSSLTVDLLKSYSVDRITLVTFYDGSRFYQYTIEASVDGKRWRTLVDAAGNTVVASSSGYASRFAPIEARYVRVNMLKNSANPGTHIVELMVYEAKKKTR